MCVTAEENDGHYEWILLLCGECGHQEEKAQQEVDFKTIQRYMEGKKTT